MANINNDNNFCVSREQSLIDILSSPRYGVECENLKKALAALGEATALCSELLSNYVDHSYAGTRNASGDDQLQLDIECDQAVFAAVRRSGVYDVAASEETPVETDVSNDNGNSTGPTFVLGFDPLDGSSVVDANFTVGSIYGVWPSISTDSTDTTSTTSTTSTSILGRTGREQVASAVALYGSRTTLCVALTAPARRPYYETPIVLEMTLVRHRRVWVVSRESIVLPPATTATTTTATVAVDDPHRKNTIFAPGNLRAGRSHPRYRRLVQRYVDHGDTLRYTGGMVPDVLHILAKRRGVFWNVSSTTARAKLRLLYEVAPVGLLMECAGGLAIHEEVTSSTSKHDRHVLDEVIVDLDQRLGVCMGTEEEVRKYQQFMTEEEDSDEQQDKDKDGNI